MGKVNEIPGAGETGARGKVGVTGTRPKRTATQPSRIVLDEITRLPRENCTKTNSEQREEAQKDNKKLAAERQSEGN